MRPPPPQRAFWRMPSRSERQETLKRTRGWTSPAMRPSLVKIAIVLELVDEVDVDAGDRAVVVARGLVGAAQELDLIGRGYVDGAGCRRVVARGLVVHDVDRRGALAAGRDLRGGVGGAHHGVAAEVLGVGVADGLAQEHAHAEALAEAAVGALDRLLLELDVAGVLVLEVELRVVAAPRQRRIE